MVVPRLVTKKRQEKKSKAHHPPFSFTSVSLLCFLLFNSVSNFLPPPLPPPFVMLRREDRVERRTSKAGATAKNASTVKRRGKGKEKASANPSGSAWFGRRRDAPTTDDVIATDGVVTDAKPDTGRGGGGTRWEEEEEEEDLDGVGDEEGEETVAPPGKAFLFLFCVL